MVKRIIEVKDMSCDHCRRAITGALQQVEGLLRVQVDLETKAVTVEIAGDIEPVMEAIRSAGYSPVLKQPS